MENQIVTNELIIKYINDYNNFTTFKIAKTLIQKEGLSIRQDSLAKRISKIRKNLEIDLVVGKQEINNQITIDSNEKEGTMVLDGKRVKSVEDLIKECNVDLNIYEIERQVVNKWEVGAKDANSKIQVTPLFQIKIWLRKRKADDLNIAEFKQGVLDDLKTTSKIVPFNHGKKFQKSASLLEINIFDLHLGKMAWWEETGENYDYKIAEKRFRDALQDLILKTQHHNIDQIIFPVGNDFFNSDRSFPFPQTTAGTPQHDDLRFQQLFREGRKLILNAINSLSQIAPVHVPIVPANHDFERTFFLGEVLEVAYHKNKNVIIDNSPKVRKYYKYFNNLLGYAHGHNENIKDLPIIMAQEVPELWAQTFFREWHLGHLHHRKTISHLSDVDYKGVQVRYMSSLSSPDAWHSHKGFIGSIKGAEAYVYRKDEGLVDIAYHNVKIDSLTK